MVEWVDTPGGSKAHVGPGLTLEVMAGAFYDWYAFAFSPIGGIGPFPCMPSAKLAAGLGVGEDEVLQRLAGILSNRGS